MIRAQDAAAAMRLPQNLRARMAYTKFMWLSLLCAAARLLA
jgi:hypothetical protein